MRFESGNDLRNYSFIIQSDLLWGKSLQGVPCLHPVTGKHLPHQQPSFGNMEENEW